MNTFKRQFLLELFSFFDLCICVFSFIFAMIITKMPISISEISELITVRISIVNLLVFGMVLFGWHITFMALGYYNSRRLSQLPQEISNVFKGVAFSALILFAVSQFYNIELLNSKFIVIFSLSLLILMISSRLLLRLVLKQLRLTGFNLRYVVIVGTNQRAMKFAQRIKDEPELGYIFNGFVDSNFKAQPPAGFTGKLLSDLEHFKEYLRSNIVDEVIIYLPMDPYYHQIENIVSSCAEQGILVRINHDILRLNGNYPKVEYLGNDMLLTYTTGQMRRRLLVFKKVFDFCAASILLILASPLLLVAALAIKLTSPGPVFFNQERLGFNKRRFTMYKFRTMVPDAEQKLKDLEHLNEINGAAFKLKNDPRITPVGRVLRKLSIDELPQLFNVLKGDMSLVGPRPLPVRDFKGFNTDWHRRRFCVKPGLTCLWQVSGRSNISFEEWMKLDLAYIDNWSPMLDMKILLKTVPVVLTGHGAS